MMSKVLYEKGAASQAAGPAGAEPKGEARPSAEDEAIDAEFEVKDS